MSCGKNGIRQVISLVCAHMDFPTKDGQDSFHELLPEVRDEIGADAASEPVESMEAGAHLRTILRQIPPSGDQAALEKYAYAQVQLMDAIESGRITFTRGEMEALTRMPAHVHVDQDWGSTGTEWRDLVEQRRCKECGEFVGRRVTHVGCMTNAGSFWQEDLYRSYYHDTVVTTDLSQWVDDPQGKRVKDYAASGVTPVAAWPDDEVVIGDTAPTYPDFVQDLRVGMPLDIGWWTNASNRHIAFTGVTDTEYVDRFYGMQTDKYGVAVRDVMIMRKARRKAFDWDDFELDLPREIPVGVADDPTLVNQRSLFALAQWGKPEYTVAQLEHMLTQAPDHVAPALLTASRTRAKTLKLLATNPALRDCRRTMAQHGYLPTSDVLSMAGSPDPLDRAAAATSPNLPTIERQMLTEDPDPVVTRAMASSEQIRDKYPDVYRTLTATADR